MDEAKAHATDSGDARLESPARRLLIFSLAIGILIADFGVLDLAGHLQDWAHLPISSEWNWFGKSMSVAFSCLVLVGSPWLRRNVGLRWRQAPGSARLSVGCFVAYTGCALASVF
jgi:hypothetical protein